MPIPVATVSAGKFVQIGIILKKLFKDYKDSREVVEFDMTFNKTYYATILTNYNTISDVVGMKQEN